MIRVHKAGLFDSSVTFRDVEETPERITECWEIEFYLSGEGLSSVNGDFFPHKKGRMLLIPPGAKRFSRSKFICFYLYLTPDKEAEAYFRNMPVSVNISDFNLCKSLFTDIILLVDSPAQKKSLLLQSRIFELLDMIEADGERNLGDGNAESGISPQIIQKAVQFMDHNLESSLKLCDIAESVGYSPVYFHRAFSRYMGSTPHDYLLSRRLENAKELLLTSDLSISRIIDRCGFSSHSYFDAAFKRQFGITPTEFRKKKYTLS